MKKDTEKKKKEICKGANDKTDNQPYPKSFTCTFILNRKEWLKIKPSKKDHVRKGGYVGAGHRFSMISFLLLTMCVYPNSIKIVWKSKAKKKESQILHGKRKMQISKSCEYTICIPRDTGVSPDKVKVEPNRDFFSWTTDTTTSTERKWEGQHETSIKRRRRSKYVLDEPPKYSRNGT